MATTNYNFNLPTVGGNAGDWGTLLNENWVSLDSILNGDGSAINIDGITADGLTLTGTITLSGTLTSATITGDLIVDTDTLFVDVSTDRVGINKNNPASALDVNGTVTASTFAGNLSGNATSATTATTATNLSGGSVSASSGSFSSDVTVSGTLSVRTAIDLADNDILRFGSGDDCEFFCNGSHMYMDLNSGIGNFYIRDDSTTRFTFDDAGSFTATGSIYAGAFYYSSDERLKQDIAPLSNALDTVSSLQGVSYSWKESGQADIGLIAQEVQKIIPEAVNDSGEFLSVNATPIVAYLIEAVKELTERVKELEAK